MNLLIDNALSPSLSHLLQERGHDALHAREVGMQGAVDPEVFAVALRVWSPSFQLGITCRSSRIRCAG